MALSPHDYRLLLDALSASPLFATLASRQILIRNTIGGYPQIAAHLPKMNLEGPPAQVADNVIRHLDGLQAAPHLAALALIIHAIEPFSGPRLETLQNLRQRLGWTDIAVGLPSSDWQDPRSVTEVLHERIVGEDTLRPLYYLRRALRSADAVVRIDLDHNPIGTGFLLSRAGLVMTNNHVIDTAVRARRAQAVFYDEAADTEVPAAARPTVIARPVADKPFLCTDPDLDFTLLRLTGIPGDTRCLPLTTAIPKRNDRVVIIQHAGGTPKRISLQNNQVAHADHRVVQYYTSTLQGSSGSPVFDDAFAVVAIHRGWVKLDAPDPHAKSTEATFYRNQGITMSAIVDYLRTHHPDLLKEITIRED